jgi:hypothetical protein
MVLGHKYELMVVDKQLVLELLHKLVHNWLVLESVHN